MPANRLFGTGTQISGSNSFRIAENGQTHNGVYRCALLATTENNIMGRTSFTNKVCLSLFPLFRVKGEKQLDIFWYSCKVGRKKPKSKTVTEFIWFTVNGIAFPVAT